MKYLRRSITATAVTIRNTVNREILINKDLLTYRKGLISIKKDSFAKKKNLFTQKKGLNKPTANSHGKFPRQMAAANRHGK